MIMLTRLNGMSMALNSDLVKLVEGSPDTVITLITGEKIVVRESTEEVILRIITFRRETLSNGLTNNSVSQPNISSAYMAFELGEDSKDI